MPDKSHRYKGHRILRCHWDGDPHGGRWYVQSHHTTGMVWADEATPHHRTLAEAREYIDERRAWQDEMAREWKLLIHI
jgi:hypothetical protein